MDKYAEDLPPTLKRAEWTSCRSQQSIRPVKAKQGFLPLFHSFLCSLPFFKCHCFLFRHNFLLLIFFHSLADCNRLWSTFNGSHGAWRSCKNKTRLGSSLTFRSTFYLLQQQALQLKQVFEFVETGTFCLGTDKAGDVMKASSCVTHLPVHHHMYLII